MRCESRNEMDPDRLKRVTIGLAWTLAGWIAVFALYHLVRAPFPFLLLLLVFASARIGDGDSGYTTALTSTVVAYYYTEPIGWVMTVSGAVSIALYIGSAIAIVHTVVALQRERDARDAMVHAVAHDLKSPLSAVALREQLVIRKIERGSLDVTNTEFLGHARKVSCDVERILSMINDLLDTSRLRSDRIQLRIETADLCVIVRDVADRLGPQCENRHASLRLHVPDEPCVGRWDVLFVDRMLTNLIVNALKYAPGKPIDVTLDQHEEQVSVVVADHGDGIPLNAQRRVFDAFFTDSIGRAGKGSHGLGLWIVQRLAQAHNGSVTLESEPGHGTSVRVALPRVCDASAAQPRRHASLASVLRGRDLPGRDERHA